MSINLKKTFSQTPPQETNPPIQEVQSQPSVIKPPPPLVQPPPPVLNTPPVAKVETPLVHDQSYTTNTQPPRQYTSPTYTPSENSSDSGFMTIFNSPFSFNGRISKSEYQKVFLVSFLGYFVLMGIVAASISIVGLAFIPLFWFFLAKGARRCHDCGNSGWLQIIPFYVFYLLIAEGDNSSNIHGNKPS